MIWAHAIGVYVNYLRTTGRSPATSTMTEQHMARFASFCWEEGVFSPEGVTRRHVAAYQQSLLWKPNSRGTLFAPTTTARMLGNVKSFFRWATRHGHVLVDPTRELRIPGFLQNSTGFPPWRRWRDFSACHTAKLQPAFATRRSLRRCMARGFVCRSAAGWIYRM